MLGGGGVDLLNLSHFSKTKLFHFQRIIKNWGGGGGGGGGSSEPPLDPPLLS